MTDKEKIRAEIERLLNKEWKWGSSIEAKFRCEAYRELLEFIDSLQEEDASEDLLGIAIELEEIIGTSPHSRLTIVEHLVKAANWQKGRDTDKFCKWLEEHLWEYDQYSCIPIDVDEIVKDSKQAMED